MKFIHILKTCIGIPAFLYISGCASISPETVKAMEGQSASVCIELSGWNGAPQKLHYASFGGKATGTAGGGGKATCGASTVEFANEGKQVKP